MKARRLIYIFAALLLVWACAQGPWRQGSGDGTIGPILKSMRGTAKHIVLKPMTMDNYVETFGLLRDVYGWKVLQVEETEQYRARLMAFVDRGCITRLGVEYTLTGDDARRNREAIEQQFDVKLKGFTCTLDRLYLSVIPGKKIQ
ncbi:MAG: hypothetical protein J6X25_07080 [Bacteroidales bacterium]|nr:hypothetical protein [Bacteroidales bacterium]